MQKGYSISNCSFSATNNLIGDLKDYRGKWVVLYFYPKDMTSGCTIEAQDFSAHLPLFENLNSVVFGLSRESIKSHERFKNKENLGFELISDPDERICKFFNVMKEKSMYGKKYMGIERSTFIIDPDGIIAHEWRNVKVDGHVSEVLAKLKELIQQ